MRITFLSGRYFDTKKVLILSTEKAEFEDYLIIAKFEELSGTIEQLVKKAP